jgi:D-methionine transport system ATP-binding protein
MSTAPVSNAACAAVLPSELSSLSIDVDARPVVRLHGVTRSFERLDGARIDAIRGVTLDVFKGEILALIGHSGAGKSTLLRLMNLLERPDQGTVEAAGHRLNALAERELRAARQDIGMVFEDAHLLNNLNVHDNVAFPLHLHGRLNAPRLEARLRETFELTGIAPYVSLYPAQLTTAQRQRVQLARALANRPAVLLCDAPTTALDKDDSRALFGLLADINRELGIAIVIASHALPLLGAVCDRAAVLADGLLVEQFATADTSRAPDTAIGRELAYYASEAYAACEYIGAAHA